MHQLSRSGALLPNVDSIDRRPHRRKLRTLVLLLSLVTINAGFAAAETPPNILLLVAEDLSPRIGAFGDEVARTPAIDELAAKGVRFTNVFTTAGVCAPSRAGLILGMHAIATGTHHMRTQDGPSGKYLSVPSPLIKAFPEMLRAAGYFTYQHAKLDYQFSGPLSGSGPSSIWDAEDNNGQWADREDGQPFFGMINYMVTHESGGFAPLGTVWPNSLIHFGMQVFQTYQRWGYTDQIINTTPEEVVVPPYYPDIPPVRASLAQHYDNIQIMDRQVDEVLKRLEHDGLADSTIVIWTTDHGDGLPRAKRDLFDLGLKVPMVIYWPDALRPAEFEPGQIDDRLVSFVDLTASLLAMAGVDRPPHFHGKDFLNPNTEPREYIFAARDRIDDLMDRQRAVRDHRFKYIRSYMPEVPGGHRSEFRDNLPIMQALWQALEAGELNAVQRSWFESVPAERLFDLEADPLELEDVATNPAYAEDLARMRDAYARFAERIPDLADLPEPELRERFWPGGKQPVTAAPRFRVEKNLVHVDSTTVGASIEVRISDGPWRLYTGPLPQDALSPEQRMTARAVRYGWAASDETRGPQAD